jgi:nitroreductase
MLSDQFQEIIDFRRSNRKFDPSITVPAEVIKKSLERAILSPNSSNMQLWEFYWIRSEEMKKKFIPICLNQSAARTAQEIVVFVTRRDLWSKRAKWNYQMIKESSKGQSHTLAKGGLDYYSKAIPLVYMRDPIGIMGFIRRSICFVMGLTRPFVRLGGNAEQRITVHKSCALAAQTFMLSIAAEGFHSCPMEGFDKLRAKRALGLPLGAEINMIIAVGKGTEEGIWGPRFRVPYDEVVFEV